MIPTFSLYGFSGRKNIYPGTAGLSAALVIRRISILTAALLLQFNSSFAGDFLDRDAEEIVEMNFSGLYGKSFEKINLMLASSESADYCCHFLRAVCYLWFISVEPEDPRYDSQIEESLNSAINVSDKIPEESPQYSTALFYNAMSRLLLAKFKSYRGDGGLFTRWSTKKAKGQAEKLSALNPDDIDSQLPLAFFYYYWGNSSLLKRTLQFVATVPRGDRDLGRSLLYDCATRGDDTKLWADAFLLHAYLVEERDFAAALGIANQLNGTYLDNSLFNLAKAECERRLGNWPEAERIYLNITAKVLSRVPSYDDRVYEISRIRTVEAQIETGKLEEAFAGLKSILIANPISPDWIVPWAHYYASRVYRSKGMWERAKHACEYALEADDYDGLHDAAEKELDKVKDCQYP